MTPYIVALIFLIVIILWQVYNQKESFQTASSTNEEDPTLMVNIRDLWGALGPLNYTPKQTANDTKETVTKETVKEDIMPAKKEVVVTKSKETAVESQPDLADEQSPEFTQEMEDRIVKNVVSNIKDQLISEHQLQGATCDMTPYAPCDTGISTNGMAQGADFQQARPSLQEEPDMSLYIRKDNIPCNKCNLSS